MVLSEDGRAYKAQATSLAVEALELAGAALLLCPIELKVTLHPKKPKKQTARPVRRIDLSNSLKIAEDALSGCLYADDKQVHKITLSLGPPIENGALIIQATEYIA